MEARLNDLGSSLVGSTPDGSGTIQLTAPYVSPTNTSSFPLSGTCKQEGSQVEVLKSASVIGTTTCSGSAWSINVDLSAESDGLISVSARITDSTGTSVSTSPIDVVKDTTAPDVTGLGPLADGTYGNSLSASPTFTWNAATDGGSGLDHYEIAIGTTTGATDTATWTAIGTITSTQKSGLTLAEGATYYPSLRAVDKAGNISVVTSGDGWIVDATAPLAATNFFDGVLNFSSTRSPIMNWLAGSDNGSGLLGYEIALGTSSGGTDVLNWTNIGDVLTSALDSLSLTGATKYFASLRSVDKAGNVSSVVNGDSWYNFKQSKLAVDVTTPAPRVFSQSAKYGSEVAISEDQSTLVVGAPADKLDALGANSADNAGAVYVYIKSGGIWTLQQKLVALGTNARISGDKFGTAVAISGDTIVVGAHQQDYDELGGNYLSTAGAAYVFRRVGSVWSQEGKLVAPVRNAFDEFGNSVGISGDSIVVGAHKSESFMGKAFAYRRSGSVWSLESELVPTGTNARIASDYYGSKVAISGDTIVVGVNLQDYDETGANALSNAGAAYVFRRIVSTWTQEQKLVATGTNARMASDNFGASVAISGDTIVVGAVGQKYDENGLNPLTLAAGAAYVFTRNASVWSQQQKLVGMGVNARGWSEQFGKSVSISGETIAVGTPNQAYDENGANSILNSGAVFIYTRSASGWSQQQKIVAVGTNARVDADIFGTSVAISGDQIISGAPQQDYDANGENLVSAAGAAYVALRSGSTWSQEQKLVDTVVPSSRTDLRLAYYGKSIAISEDGSTLVVGAPGDDTDANGQNYITDTGAAYVYIKVGQEWVFQQKLVATGLNSRIAQDNFGNSVSISGDTIAVGAVWQDYDDAGNNNINNTGAAYIFTRTAGLWSQQAKLVGVGTNSRTAANYFGHSIAVDGDTVAIGAYQNGYDKDGLNLVSNAGSVFIYKRNAGVWSFEQKIVAEGTNARQTADYFGYSLSLSGDTVVVGAYQHAYDETGTVATNLAGAAFVFTRTGALWSLQQKLVASGLNARMSGDFFGKSVAIRGDKIVVAAVNQQYDADGANSLSSAGAAYVFTRSGSSWSQQQKLVATGLNGRLASDQFGSSVAMSGNIIVVGTSSHDYDSNGENLALGAGATYVFANSSGTWSQQLKLTPTGTNARNASDQFGYAVTVYEDPVSKVYTIGIGASSHSYDTTGANSVPSAGAAFVYH